MNTQLNIKTRRPLFSQFVVTLLVGIVVVLVSGGVSVQAQTTTTTTAPADPTAPVDSSTKIVVKGTVTDPNGNITVSGSVIVNCRRVIDTTSATAPPLVVLDFDFSNLSGTQGTSVKTQTVYVTGGNHSGQIRPLQASDTIIVPIPYYDSTKDALSASSWLATATLNFDVGSGKLTGGSINVGNNVVTAAAVGTFTVN